MIFSKGYRVTQYFGARPEYYKQFGLKGHEGVDLAPKVKGDEDAICFADGIVVKDEDRPRSGAYGVYLTIWHPQLKKASQWCHLDSNNFSVGEKISKGQVVGNIGSTGNSTGTHLHLNLFEVDDNGVRLNRNNGYNGGIDPLSFIRQLESEGEKNMAKTVNLSEEKFKELVQKATQWDTIADFLKLNKMDAAGGKTVIETIRSTNNEHSVKTAELNTRIATLEEELTKIKNLPPKEIIKEVTVPVNNVEHPTTVKQRWSGIHLYLDNKFRGGEKMNNSAIKALRELGRLIAMAVVGYLLTDFVVSGFIDFFFGATIDPWIRLQIIALITTVLKTVDKFLHELGKETGNETLKKGLTFGL